MLTLPAAARLLTQTHDVAGAAALGRAFGFDAEPAPLDGTGRAALGLPASVRTASVLEGRGILRALCMEMPRGTLTREAAAAVSLRVQRRSPFALWLVIGAERGGAGVFISSALLAPRPRAFYLSADRNHVVDSDAETVRALAAAGDGLDLLVHARWCELLGREALTQRFFRSLEQTVTGLGASIARDVPEPDARTLSLLTTTRLLFLAFLEAKGWLDGDHGFLRRTWEACMTGRGNYHRNVLLPLCFGTLNTQRSRRATAARAFGRIPFLNGGLFTRTPIERQYARVFFPDESLGFLVSDLLGRWRFTVREHATSHAEAAVDPEMLGRAFECLMASRDRRASGTFYTPRSLVARVFDAALDTSITEPSQRASLATLRAADAPATTRDPELAQRLAALRVLDPACGSGAFLVHALEELASLRSRLGDQREPGALRRDILARQLFGVDREPTAVWLCELRLWLAVVVETAVVDPLSVPPLPNLDAQVRIGDALAGDAFAQVATVRRSAPLAQMRERYARATGVRKRTLVRALARLERGAAIESVDARIAATTAARRDVVAALRGRDLFGNRVVADSGTRAHLETLRRSARALRSERRSLERGSAVAFDFAAQFADVGAHGGFDVVMGNPPWVRLHRIPPAERTRLHAKFDVYRNAGWKSGAAGAGAGSGFASQVDLAAIFVERALSLVRDGGTISLLVPAKLWRSLAGGGLRHLLTRTTRAAELEDWSEARATFDAAVYPSLVVATRGAPEPSGAVHVAEHHRDRTLRWAQPRSALAFDDTPGAPWLWLPPDPRAGFERVRALGVPLAERADLRPRLGVKCGLNEAFIVRAIGNGSIVAQDGRRGSIEPHMLRPLLRGESVTAWSIGAATESIVFAHDASLNPLKELPPLARRWLLPWRHRLSARSDQRGRTPWWSLFRVDSADARWPRVVWADMSRTPRAAVLRAGDLTVPINSCYALFAPSTHDAYALAAWLNSPIAAAWLSALAEPARGGFRRLLGWTVALLPIPRDWERAAERLAPIGLRAAKGDVPQPGELLDASLDALGAAHHDIESLLTWGHR